MATDMRTAGPQPAPVAVASASTRLESRRLLAEAVGTFFLVLVAAGGAVVNAVSYAQVDPAAAAAAAGPDGAGVIYTIGETSGAPQPGGHHGVRRPGRLPLAAGSRLPGRSACRGGGRGGHAAACSAPPTGWVMETVPAPAAPPALVGRPGRRFRPTALEPSRYAFLGVRGCDLAALGTVLGVGRRRDTAFTRARAGLFVIAVNCTEPGGVCFCASMGRRPGL